MTLSRWLRRLRIFATVLVVVGISSTIGGIIYLHEKGFTDASSRQVSKEMERYGVFVTFDKLSFHIIHGLTASNVQFFRTANREIQIAELPAIAIHVDKSKLMRGKLKINTLSITNANLTIPLVRGDEDSPILNISNVSGSIDLPGTQSASTNDLTGIYEGIRVSITCNIWRDAPKEKFVANPEDTRKRVAHYKKFLSQLKMWSWPENSRPELKIFIEGNLSTPEKVDFDFHFSAAELEYNGYVMDDVTIKGDWNQNLITLDDVTFNHQSEQCSITTDFDIQKFDGRFKINTNLHIKEFVQKVFATRIMENFSSAGKINLSASGAYQLPLGSDIPFSLDMIGKVDCSNFSFLSTSINTLESDFSWNNGDLFLDNLSIDHNDGKLSGRVLIKDKHVLYKVISSLKAKAYFPFIKLDLLKLELEKLHFPSNAVIDLHANGSINLQDKSDWQSNGYATLKNFSYNGVPIILAHGNYLIDAKTTTITDLTTTFDYTDYPLRKRYNGPKSGTLVAKSLYFEWQKKRVELKSIRGTAWPAPVLQLFAPPIAEHLEDYQFHLPPTLACSGTVNWNLDKKNNDMRLIVGFNSTGKTTYNFLDEDITLSNVKAQVSILADKVQVNKLSGRAFDGNLSGYIHITPSSEKYSGRFQWDHLRLGQICKTYKIKGVDAGILTGSFTLRGIGSKVSTLDGHGNIALSNGDLFNVPLFGPLSTLIDGVITPIARKQVLHQRARDFSCNFSTKNGVFFSKDLASMTPSTTFTGEGWIDLNQEILDITIRMNFRGLMGLAEVPMKVIELPFQALKTILTGKEVRGLRQFRGSGKMSDPKWRFAPFQPPRNGKNDPIFRKPPRAQIIK